MNGFLRDLKWNYNSEYVVHKRWTYLPKKMSSGKWIWLSTYYYVEDTANADPRHMIMRIRLYSEPEWFLRKMQGLEK